MNKLIVKDFTFLFILYFISFFLLVLNYDGLYWDDWILFNQTPETIKVFFTNFQNSLFEVFNLNIRELGNGIISYRLFAFLGYFFSAICIYYILKTIKYLNNIDIFYITLFYLIIPVISSRVLISIIPFFFPVFVFFFTFLLLTKYLKNNNLLLRIIVLVGFYLSFYTNSILVFYALVLIYIFYIKYELVLTFKNIKNFTFKFIDFLLLPIVFFLIKNLYFKSNGIYEGYNSLGDTPIYKIIFDFLKSIHTSIVDVLLQSLSFSLTFWFGLLILFFIIKKWFMKSNEEELNKKSKPLFYFGFLVFILAVFPYIAVSKLPEINGFSSRFQLLIPLALAFIFYFGVNLIVGYFNLSIKTKKVLLFILISSFIIKNINDYYHFHSENLYKTSIIENFKRNTDLKENTTFIVNNNLQDKLVYDRKIPFYEWNGMLKLAFNDDKRLMIYYGQYKNIERVLVFKKHKEYNFSSWEETKPYVVTISNNFKERIRQSTLRRLIILKFKNYDKYLVEVRKLTIISTKKLESLN